MSFGPEGWVNMNTASEAYTILDNVTKIIGKHTVKGGFLYRLEHSAYESGFPTSYGFSGGITSDRMRVSVRESLITTASVPR